MTISIVRAVICHMSEREGDDERPGAGGRRPGERRRHCTTDGVHHSDQREAHQPVGHSARQGIRGRVTNRDVIGQAKGVLMNHFKVDAVRAFDMLKHVS